jgi:hypothetical protein
VRAKPWEVPDGLWERIEPIAASGKTSAATTGFWVASADLRPSRRHPRCAAASPSRRPGRGSVEVRTRGEPEKSGGGAQPGGGGEGVAGSGGKRRCDLTSADRGVEVPGSPEPNPERLAQTEANGLPRLERAAAHGGEPPRRVPGRPPLRIRRPGGRPCWCSALLAVRVGWSCASARRRSAPRSRRSAPIPALIRVARTAWCHLDSPLFAKSSCLKRSMRRADCG